MNKTTQSTFMKLYKQDVSKYSEKKGQFTYLSWAHAWSLLKKTCPDARYGVTKAEDGSPFFVTQCGFFVDVWAAKVAFFELSNFKTSAALLPPIDSACLIIKSSL